MDDIADIDHPELLKEVQEGLVEVLAAMLHGQETVQSTLDKINIRSKVPLLNLRISSPEVGGSLLGSLAAGPCTNKSVEAH